MSYPVQTPLPKSFQCPYCERCWPPMAVYDKCPMCREPTRETQYTPLTKTTAEREAVHAAFGWWLWEHDRV